MEGLIHLLKQRHKVHASKSNIGMVLGSCQPGSATSPAWLCQLLQCALDDTQELCSGNKATPTVFSLAGGEYDNTQSQAENKETKSNLARNLEILFCLKEIRFWSLTMGNEVRNTVLNHCFTPVALQAVVEKKECNSLDPHWSFPKHPSLFLSSLGLLQSHTCT